MSTKLKGSLYIDDDIKLIYRDSMYKIFVDAFQEVMFNAYFLKE